MPFTFFAHQAVVLPLKLVRPRWFCGTALVFGSMAPDVEYFLRGRTYSGISHQMIGQVLFCLPLTLLMVWLFKRVMVLPLSMHAPSLGPFKLKEYAVLGAKEPAGYYKRAALSALIGSLSHVVWDHFTHVYGFAVRAFSVLRAPVFELSSGYVVKVYKVLQHGSTLVGGTITVVLLAVIGRRQLLRRWSQAQAPKASTPQSARWMKIGLVVVVLGAPLVSALVTFGVAQSRLQSLSGIVSWGLRAVTIFGFALALLCAQVQRRMTDQSSS